MVVATNVEDAQAQTLVIMYFAVSSWPIGASTSNNKGDCLIASSLGNVRDAVPPHRRSDTACFQSGAACCYAGPLGSTRKPGLSCPWLVWISVVSYERASPSEHVAC